MAEHKRLYRSRDDKVLMGLCGGIGKYLNIDPTAVRVVAIILEFVTAGLLIIIYLIVGLFVPKEPINSASSTTPKN